MFDISRQWNPKAIDESVSWDAAFSAHSESCKRIGFKTHTYLNK